MAAFRNQLLKRIVASELRSWDTVIFVDMDLLDKAWLPSTGWLKWQFDQHNIPRPFEIPAYYNSKTKSQG